MNKYILVKLLFNLNLKILNKTVKFNRYFCIHKIFNKKILKKFIYFFCLFFSIILNSLTTQLR